MPHLRPLLALSLLLLGFLAHPAGASAQAFVHPGGLHTRADLDRMKEKVAANAHPWIDDWNALTADPKAQDAYRPTPAANMGVSRQRAQNDAAAAYLNALRWSVSGDRSHADCAVRILNAWSAAVNVVPTGNDQPGLGGIPVGSFALAAEVLRTYPGWSAGDQARFKRMLLAYFYPVCHDFLTRHNNRGNSAFWANWDTANMRAILGIGVFCDDRAKFDEAVEYYKHGAGTGAIANAVPFRYPGGLGQWQESGRDQAHVMGGMGLLCEFCQIAWNQGVDLFGYDDNRLLAGAEYAAQYTLWKGVPYTFYNNSDEARQFYVSQNYHGRLQCSHFELLYNHYAVLRHVPAPNVRLLAELKRPESGDVDAFGYGTLTFTLDAAASPVPSVAVPPVPQDLAATPGLGRVDLAWSPSGAYTARGYEISRATAAAGPYTSLYSTDNWTTPRFTDTQVQPGTRYFYTVAALNQSGKSAPSAAVDATPAAEGALPDGWHTGNGVRATHADAAGGSFVVAGVGTGFELDPARANFVSRAVNGDVTITARLIERRGPVDVAGLLIRDAAPGEARAAALTLGGTPGPQVMHAALPGEAKAAALTLGETGGRQTRFRAWPTPEGRPPVQLGDDYTWIPVWFRLRRVGGIVTASQSSDGIEWFEVGKSAVSMSPACVVGMITAGTGKPGNVPAQATFDHVRVEPAPPVPPEAPAALTAAAAPGASVELAWKNAAGSERAGTKVEASLNDGPFYEIADLAAGADRFVNTGLPDPAALRYRVRAYNPGGYSAYSEPAAPPPASAK